jgi:hypothetical protein
LFIRRPTVVIAMPAGLFGFNDQTQVREAARNTGIGPDRLLVMGNRHIGFRVLLGTFTRGKYFKVKDWEELRSP